MKLEFEYKSEKGIMTIDANLQQFTNAETEGAIEWFHNLRKVFGFNKKTFILILDTYYTIRFTKHTISSYTLFGTINQFPSAFFEAATNEAVKPRIKCLFRLNEKGVELMNEFDSLIPEQDENLLASFFIGYIELLKVLK
jgi:hypothetical protein